MTALCTYPVDKCNAVEILDTIANHQFTLTKKEGKWERIDNSCQKNLTKINQAEKKLEVEHARLRATLDAMPVGVWIADINGRIIETNEQANIIWGKPPNRPDSMTEYNKYRGWWPDTGKRLQAEDWAISRALTKGEVIVGEEVNIQRFGGSFGTILNNAAPIRNNEGQIIGGVVIEQDITRRKQEEYRISRYNNVLKGINRIFSSVVKAETEEDLGIACLSVALETTSSQIGFVGEISTDGLLHDIAISKMGWEQCLMHEKIGNIHFPEDLILHGLYGHVINSGKGFFTNNPSSHPDSIGLLQGHPLLTSFLGVPLILDGKKIGIIAVANREGGYSYEQQEDLEAIAPAVVQALQKKRDEQERSRTEDALIRRENEFRTLAENSPDVIARFDRQNRHLYANPAAAEVYGYSQEEIIGKNHSKLGRDPEQTKFWERHHQKVFVTGQPETMEFRYISPQGKEYYFNTRIVPEFVNGKVTSVLAISRDIIKIKQAEAKLKDTLDNLDKLVKERTSELQKAYDSLKKSERNLAEAQEMAHIGSWERDFATNELHWSDETYRIFGLKPQELKVNYDTFLNYVHLEDQDRIDNAAKEALKGKPFDIDYRIITANGEERIVHEKDEVVFGKKKNPVRFIGTVQDITERKQAEENLRLSEERYRSFIQNFQGVAFQIDKNFELEFIHGAAKEITGYSEEELFLYTSWRQLVVPEDIDMFLEAEQKAAQSPGDYHAEIEYRIRTNDGKIKWMHELHQKICGEAGSPEKYIGLIYDITEKKKIEEDFAKFEIARQKEIHHRIKNNLQVISSLLDLQAEKFNNRELVQDSEVLEAFRESQDRVISMALIHEELYKGGGLETLNFSPYIEELANTIFHTYRLGNTDISLSMDLEENLFFDMDTAVPLGIIINELVSNSLKHAFPDRKEGEIRIKLHREKPTELEIEDYESTSTSFILIISDNGVGIPENLDIEDLDSLGMQLIISLVDQLNGKLELKRNDGTAFTIRFS